MLEVLLLGAALVFSKPGLVIREYLNKQGHLVKHFPVLAEHLDALVDHLHALVRHSCSKLAPHQEGQNWPENPCQEQTSLPHWGFNLGS